MKINQDGEQEEDETFKWMAEKILKGIQTKKPNLELFDEKITQLNRIKQQISEMKTSIDIGWIRVNSNPLIKQLTSTVTEWIEAYTSFLFNNTVSEITNIQKFIDEVGNGIKVIQAREGDSDAGDDSPQRREDDQGPHS
jgi:dynein heavy chain, axonemal